MKPSMPIWEGHADGHADYAVAVALASAQVIAAVQRADDPTPHIQAALSIDPPERIDPVNALVTVLAAQVDPDTSLPDRLDWVTAYDPLVIAACGAKPEAA